MSTEMVLVKRQDARLRHSRFCRLLSDAMNGQSEALANATGIYPSQLRGYASLHDCETRQRRQPLYTADVLLRGLMEVFGERGRLAGIEMVSMLADSLGCSLVPTPQGDRKALGEEFGDAIQAAARLHIEAARRIPDGIDEPDAAVLRPLAHELMVQASEFDEVVAMEASIR